MDEHHTEDPHSAFCLCGALALFEATWDVLAAEIFEKCCSIMFHLSVFDFFYNKSLIMFHHVPSISGFD